MKIAVLELRYARKSISVFMYSSLVSVSISTERRACVPNIIIEEHRCVGIPGRNRNTSKNVFRSSWKVPLFLGRTSRNFEHANHARFMVSAK